MKIRFLLLPFFLLLNLLSFGQVIYQNDFGDNLDINFKPFNNVPPVFDANLSNSSWTTSAPAFGGLAGNGGGTSESLSLSNSSGTPTMTLTFNVAAGFQLAVTQFNFWRVRSGTGAQNWSMTINGTAVGSGTLSTTAAMLGATNVSNTISGLTGTITIVITFSGATSATGTCRIDDFTLIGSVTPIASVGTDIISGPSPATLSSLNNTPSTITLSTQGVEVWQFTIREGGATGDADTTNSNLTAITLFQSGGNSISVWTDAILSCALFDGSTFLANGTVTATQIIFSSLSVVIPDNTQKTLSLRLTLRCPLGNGARDGEDFGFLVNSVNTTLTGSPSAVFTTVSTDAVNVISVVASQLRYTLQPTTTGVNNTMPVVLVRATDACGNLDLNFAGSISLSSTGTMTPVTPVPAVAGVATFSTIVHTSIGTNLTLTASSGPLSIVSNIFDIITVTTLQPGDIAILAFNANTATGDDEICFVSFVDILPGTRIDITDNSYQKCGSANGWGISEGWIRLERAGSTLPRGTIVCLTVSPPTADTFVISPDPFNWNCTNPQPSGQGIFNLNGTGEQIFFMTNGNVGGPNVATGASDAGTYSGSFLYGFNTRGNIWAPACVAGANGTQNSGKPINFDCFLAWPTAQADLCKYTGPMTNASQRDWLNRINEPANWTGYTSNPLYDLGPNFYGATITILPGTPSSSGIWIGNKSTNWFDCGNWQSLRVPDIVTDVVVGTNATQPINIDATAPFASSFSNVANCRDLTISNHSVRIEAATSNVLNVNRNLTITGTGSLDMDDNNAGTADGQLNLSGNWNNTLGNNSFLEGNGTVQFTGTGTQTINNVLPLGTESFFNVILNNNFDTGLSNDLVATNNLTINTSRTLTIDSANGYVRVNNELINNGNILIDNNGQLIQVNEVDNNSGDYTSSSTRFQVRRTAQAKDLDYVYWSSPINNFNVSGLPTDNRFAWSPTATNANGTQGTWQAASGTMSPGRGYIARASNGAATPTALPVTFNSGRPNNGQFTFGITRGTITTPPNAFTTALDDNWNLVGNPYPSAIDAEEFLVANQTKIQGSVWIWRHGLDPSITTSPFYQNFTYNYSSTDYIKYNGLGSTEPDTFAGKIGLGQGFMVSMLDSAGPSNTILFTNNMRSDASFGAYDNADFFRIGTPPSETIEEKSRIWLDIFNNTSGQMDRTLMGYSTNSTMGIDHMYDCVFVPRLDVSLFSVVEDKPFIIQGRPLPFDINDRVPMGINITEAGSHTIAIYKTDGLFEGLSEIYIEDALLNITHDLKQAPYIFTSDIGLYNNRFSLKYTNSTLGNTEFDNSNSIVVSSNNKIITVTSTLEKIDAITVYDILGRELFSSKKINSNQMTIDSISQSNQALIVKIKLNNGKTLTRKTVY